MSTLDQIALVSFTDPQYKIIQEHAKKADIGGKSLIDDRRKYQPQDQLVGQLSEAALFVRLGKGFDAYDERRKKINKTPLKGDGGYDMIDSDGRKVDSKGSLARKESYSLLNYHLYIHDQERKHCDRFVFSLVEPHDWQTVKMIGWWPDYLFNAGTRFRDPKEKKSKVVGSPTSETMPTRMVLYYKCHCCENDNK